MKKSDELFKIFNSKLKKYSTCEVAKMFASFDRYYFKNHKDEPLTKTFYNGYTTTKVLVRPWLFKDIIYYSTFFNDHRSNITEDEAWNLYLLYSNYSEAIEAEYADFNYADTSQNILTPILYGHMQVQAIYQVTQYLFINRFNRNYHLLKNVELNSISLNTIINERYQIDLKTYCKYLSIIALLSVSFTNLTDKLILNTIYDQDLYLTILDDLSITYSVSRSKNNKEIFDVLPILHTGLDEYLVPSICNLVSNLKDKLCWLLKDEFNKKSSSKNIFVVKFGEIFENYVFEILIKQYGKANVNKIPRVKDEKSADFIISSKNYLFIIEVKSGVASINAKLENLDIQSLNNFIERNVVDAMKQLDFSSKKFKDEREIICIIVNYDLIYVEDCILFDITSRYEPKYFNANNLILFGIDNFENFIYKFNTLNKLEELLVKYNGQKLNVHKLKENCEISSNYFFDDIFTKETDDFIRLVQSK